VSEGEIPAPPTFSRLDVGIMIVLVSMAAAGLIGLIAVFDADNGFSAIGIALGVTVVIFQSGATIACALACLARRRLELPSLATLVAVGLYVDLFLLAIWLDIDSEWYGKLVGVAGAWAFFALLILGLTLAAQPRDTLARALYVGVVATSLLGGVLASVLVLDLGEANFANSSVFGIESYGNESVLRPLAAVLVVVAALWFGALAASRVERDRV
jgi:hypothetical protein